MLKSVIFILSTIFLQLVYSQGREYEKLDNSNFNRLVYENFTSVVSANNGSLGNFASVNSEEKEIKFGATFIRRNELAKFPSAITVNIKGGNEDDILPFFADNELSSFGVELKAHILFKPDKATIEYNADKYIDYKKSKYKIMDKYSSKLAVLSFNYVKNNLEQNLADLQIKYDEFPDSLDVLERKIKVLTKQIEGNSDAYALIKKVTKFKKDTAALNYEINYRLPSRIQVTIDSLQELQVDSMIYYDKESQLLLARQKELSKLDKIEALGYRIQWFTISSGLSRNGFKLFNNAVPFEGAISSETHITPSVGISFNSYTRSYFKKARYWSVGFDWQKGNNLDSLSSIKIIERTNYGANPNEAFSDKETSAYIGTYQDDLERLTIFADSYNFLDRNEIVALHLNPNLLLISDKVIFSTVVGLLISFKKKDKPESIVNTEVFYNFFDFSNDLDRELDLLERGNVGLRVAFPINFKTNK